MLLHQHILFLDECNKALLVASFLLIFLLAFIFNIRHCKLHEYNIYFVYDHQTYFELVNLLSPEANPFWEIKCDLLGPGFPPIGEGDDKNKKKDIVKAILITEKKNPWQTDEEAAVGIACRVIIKSTGEVRWLSKLKKNSELQGDKDEICRKLVKEFNQKYKESHKKITWRSYLSRENVFFVVRLLVQYGIPMYVNYKINTRRNN